MDSQLLTTLVDERNGLLELLETQPAPNTHRFRPNVRYVTNDYGFLHAITDVDGTLGCDDCGASRFNPGVHPDD
jgi:hypothetical protein